MAVAESVAPEPSDADLCTLVENVAHELVVPKLNVKGDAGRGGVEVQRICQE